MKDSGPAFPWNQTWDPGLSRREWFAARALMSPYLTVEPERPERESYHTFLARAAFLLADAMIAESEREEKK